MDGIVADVAGGKVGAAAATDTDAITMINICCDVIEAAPTPSSCVLTVAGAATVLSATIEQAEEQEKEEDMQEQLQPEEDEGQEEEEDMAEQQQEEQEFEEQQQQEEEEFEDQQQQDEQPMDTQHELQTAEGEEQQQDEQVEEESSATTQTRQKISLPWDFTATELCRSCGKPNTELYELFEQEQVEHKSSNTSIGGVDSGDINIDESNNGGNKNPRVAATVATETTSTEANQQQQQQQNKMFNILQDMQIWQLRIKSNDGLPQRICPKCTAQFCIIGKFRRKCLKVQIRLRAMYEERRLEEQQFLQSLDDKDIPPVLDIGNDLINDNYGQPLSEVELFESNWNAAQSTHNESLSHDLLVNETVKTAMDAQDNDADALQADAAVSCPVLNELEDVIKATTDCPELVLDSNTSLVNSIDLEVNANIDEESLLDTQAIFKTNTKKITTCSTVAQGSSEIHIHENLPLLLQAGSASPNNYYVKDDLNLLMANQSEGIPVSKKNESLTKNSVEIISIENLDNFDLLTTPTTSKQAAAIQNMQLGLSTFGFNQPKALENKNFHDLPNYNEQKDCYKEQEETNLHNALETKNLSEQELMKINEPTKQQSFDLLSLEEEFVTEGAVEKTERSGVSLTQSRSRNVSDEGMKFVSKGALKEYSSSPISYDDSQISGVYTQTTDPCCSKQAYTFNALISPQRQLLVAETVAKRKSGDMLLKTTLEPISDIEPQNDELVPYAQKRKKIKSRAKPASLKRKQHQHELSIAKANLLQQTCECSVRICRLSARKLFKLQVTGGVSEIDNEQEQKIKNLNDTDLTVVDNRSQTAQYPQLVDDSVVSNVVSSKKHKLSLQPDLPLVHSSRKRIPHWKTKAEMKANVVDNVVLRKTTLRRKLKLDLETSKKRCILKTKDSFSNDSNKCNKNTESVEQHQSDPLAVAKKAQMELPKHITTVPQPRPRGRPRKLSIDKIPKLQANLKKLRQRNLEVSKKIESNKQFPKLLDVTDDVAAATPAKEHSQTSDESFASIAKETTLLSPSNVVIEDIHKQPGKETISECSIKIAEANVRHPLENNAASTKIDKSVDNAITQQDSNKQSTECDMLIANVSIENAADTQVCLQQLEAEVNVVKTSFKKETNPKQTKQHDEPNELIVRVPLAALTEEFQRLHFSINEPRDNVTERECNTQQQTADVAQANPKTAATANWLQVENQNETETKNKNDEHAFLETQINFCESATAEECSEFAGTRFMDLEKRAEIVESVEAPSSQNDSDQSEFYGFGNDSDAASAAAAAAAAAYDNSAQSTTSISSQINDYINDFQTHCLSGDEKSTPPHSFQHDNDEQRTCLPSNETSRNCTQRLHHNAMDNYVDNTLNGLLNDIQDQNIFSPSTTPLVTMESEDFHHHSSYSPLSEVSDQTHSTHQDFIKSNLCDLSDPGPTVNPSHTIEVIGHRDAQGNLLQNVFAPQHQYNNYVECFTEDSTQSELIGFQNDIPCFENIELNSSTPRHSNTPPPPTVSLTMQPTTTAGTRTNNSALQGAIQQHVVKQLEYNVKQGEEGNVQYLGLTNEGDLCTSLTADAMGLVCTTSNGVQMHTPTLTNPMATQQNFEGSFENDVPPPEADESASKEYAVDRATLQLTQLFTEIPVSESSPSSSHGIANVNRDVRKKNSVLSKYVGSKTSNRLIYPKKPGIEHIELNPSAKQHYVTLVPNDSGSNTAQLSVNDSTQEMLNIGNAKYTLYTEVLPQELQWQSPSTGGGTQDQQTTTTTYYINASELHQSNLISTTTISVSPLIGGGDVGAESNLTLLPTQLAPQAISTGVTMQAPSNDLDKRSVDANENYIEGMQNQPIMIVFPPDYINDAPSVSAVYNPAANQVTITPLQSTIHASAQPQITNTISAPSNNVTHTVLSSSPAPSTADVTIPSPHSKHQQQKVNLSCRFCHKRPKFTNNLDYSNHIIATHPGENPFNCPQCPMFFTRRALRQQHIVEVHGSNRFHCAQCGQSFCAQRTLDMHLQRYHAPTDASCSSKKQRQSKQTQQWHERSTTSIQQQVHVEDVHLQVTEEQQCEESNQDDNTQLETDSSSSTAHKPPHRILGCPDCDDSFDDLDSQESHTHQISSHSHHQSLSQTPNSGPATMPSPEQTEPDSTSTTTLRQFRKQRTSSKSSLSSTDIPERVLRSSHQCIFCDEQFTNESTLRKHHQSVHGNETSLPFVCTMCKRGFRMRTALQRHMETHDSVGRPYECSICLVRFPRPSQLTLHKLTVHFLRKPHACQICGKQFGTESALKTHEKFHGEKKVDCDECHKKCLLKKDLRKYRRVHIGDNFYKCDYCPTTFAHYTRLCAHLKSHLPVGMYNEDPPLLPRERQREPKELEHQQQSESTELNETNVESELNDPLESSI